MTIPTPGKRSRWASARALFFGFLTVVVLSLGTDQVLHALHVYPPWGQPMFDPGLNLMALGYRCVYAVLGSWIAARLAPSAPMRHAMALGWIGLVLSAAGLAAAVAASNLGPLWYPIALVVTTLPCAWLGGIFSARGRATMTAAR